VPTVSGRLEASLASYINAVLLYELTHPALARPDGTGQQLLPHPWQAIAAFAFDVDSFDVHEQRIVAQAAALITLGLAVEMLLVPAFDP